GPRLLSGRHNHRGRCCARGPRRTKCIYCGGACSRRALTRARRFLKRTTASDDTLGTHKCAHCHFCPTNSLGITVFYKKYSDVEAFLSQKKRRFFAVSGDLSKSASSELEDPCPR